MNIINEYKTRIETHVNALIASGIVPQGIDVSRATVEPPREAAHGDLASNIAMVLAKAVGMKPRDLAEHIAKLLEADEDISAVDIAGPGFINIKLKQDIWHDLARRILRDGPSFGRSTMGQGEPVNLEYVSANPTGPMHVGHARGAVVGDALARLLEAAGYKVTKEYYINDAGGQVRVLAQSALLRMREALGETIEIPEGLYPGDYLKPVGEALAKAYGNDLLNKDVESQIDLAKATALPMMMEMIREDLAALGVSHDHFLSEQSLHDSGAVNAALEELDKKGLVYIGELEPPKGITPPADWEPEPQTLFKSTQFGDDSDRALKKSDGTWTYFAPDIACHFDKYNRGFSKMINVWGADHAGYIKRMSSAVTAITDAKASLKVLVCQMVKLQRDGEPVKMSKRSGEFITLREVVDEVGRDALRFMMLTRKSDAPIDFDFTLVKQQSRDNPVFYVQYAHARICSVLRNAAAAGFKDIQDSDLIDIDLTSLNSEAEINLIRQMASYPRLIEAATEALEPHRIVFYLQELAAAFHALWNAGKEDTSLRFIHENDLPRTCAKLALLIAVKTTIANALSVIGVEAQDEMR